MSVKYSKWPYIYIYIYIYGPRGEICPLGGMFTPLFTLRGESSLLFRRIEGRTENLTPRGQISPCGTTSPRGSKFAPKDEVKNGPLETECLMTRAEYNAWSNYIPGEMGSTAHH
jgi:hypothetical protein